MASPGQREGQVSSNGSAVVPQDLFVERPAHNWESKKRAKPVYDDGTITYFWRAHRITVLVIFLLALVYFSLYEEPTTDSLHNLKRGLCATLLVFVMVGVTFMPDGPFIRPHPVLWRTLLVIHILYQLGLVFLLFQTVDDARQYMAHFDAELGKPLAEKDYGGNCLIYDPGNPDFPWHNLLDKMDGFVVVHFIGWWLKTLILRDWWLCLVISAMFEVLEYTLEHQLPNFSECWWDHWLMDFLICNMFGIYLGMKTLMYLNMKDYNWRGMWSYPTYRGKLKRIMLQFTPHSWIDFDWRPSASLKRWIGMLGVISVILLTELNTFYLKWVLWLPPPHTLCLLRLILWLFWGAAGMTEYFRFLDDPRCNKLGTAGWMCISTIATECFIVLKFDWETVTKPLPPIIFAVWSLFLAGLLGWSFWHFYINRLLWHTEHKLNGQRSPDSKGSARGKADGDAANNNQDKSVSAAGVRARSKQRRP